MENIIRVIDVLTPMQGLKKTLQFKIFLTDNILINIQLKINAKNRHMAGLYLLVLQ